MLSSDIREIAQAFFMILNKSLTEDIISFPISPLTVSVPLKVCVHCREAQSFQFNRLF